VAVDELVAAVRLVHAADVDGVRAVVRREGGFMTLGPTPRPVSSTGRERARGARAA
jgi:hypothetical protein